jgi:hypothetical protein
MVRSTRGPSRTTLRLLASWMRLGSWLGTSRIANATSPWVEQRVVAFALSHPGLGPARIAAELANPDRTSCGCYSDGVWRVRRRHGCPPGPGAMGWWPAMRHHRSLNGRCRHPNATSRSRGKASDSG